ncbi:MAG: site-specific integrase [Bacteroidia bacterium]|nr:site-specific integrase [Bacteroidia bacterium]MBT8277405.1 site-specific integrase [Bacteroidia bacterium]NNL34169.1 site-specific integrase [Flavobacteriaceae bacterium]
MKLNIRYLLYKSKTNSSGKCPVRCRVTYHLKRKEFSTGLFIKPDNWNSKQQLVKPPEPDAEIINTRLSLIKTKINKAFLMLQVQEEHFTVADIYSTYKGEKRIKDYNTIEFFNRYLHKIRRLIGIDIQLETWKKFEYVKRHVQAFIKWQYKTNDYPLKELKQQFLVDLEYYLKVEKKLGQATINKAIQRFRKPVKIAVAEGFLDRDPFLLHKAKRVKKEIIFLSPEELKALENHEFVQLRLKFVKELFVFSCYTGLAYNELMLLESKHITKRFDGNLWIQMKRQKTSKELSIPLLPKALRILEMYKSEEGLVFPRTSNQNFYSKINLSSYSVFFPLFQVF